MRQFIGKNALRGPEADLNFFGGSYKIKWQLPGTFFGMKNIFPTQSYCILKSRKYIHLYCAREV